MKVPFRHVLVYLDGSEGSINALMYAILLAKSTGAALDAKRHLRHAERLAASKDLEITSVTKEGSPHHVVMDYIKNSGVDLLVIGSVNAIRSRRDELTSENDRMLRTSPCPVLVVRDQDDIWAEFEEV